MQKWRNTLMSFCISLSVGMFTVACSDNLTEPRVATKEVSDRPRLNEEEFGCGTLEYESDGKLHGYCPAGEVIVGYCDPWGNCTYDCDYFPGQCGINSVPVVPITGEDCPPGVNCGNWSGGGNGIPYQTTTGPNPPPPPPMPSINDEIGTVLPYCPTATARAELVWCYLADAPNTAERSKINAALNRMDGLGSPCTEMATVIRKMLDSGSLRLFNQNIEPGFGGSSGAFNVVQPWMVLAREWVTVLYDADHYRVDINHLKRTLQTELAHEADHILFGGDELHRANGSWTPHQQSCSEFP